MAYGRNRRTITSKTTKKSTTTSRRPRNKKTGISLETKINKILHKKAETKMKTIDLTGNNMDPVPINASGLATGLLNLGWTSSNILQSFAIKQGTNQEERIGNSISNCYLRVKGFVKTELFNNKTNTSTLPYELHVIFYKQKNYGVLSDNTTPIPLVETEYLKQYPDNSNGPIVGDVVSTLYPYNKSQYIIKKKMVFRMRALGGEAPPPLAQPLNTQLSNFPAFRRFACSIPISKTLKYNDKTNHPLNDWLSVSAFVIDGSGQVLDPDQVRASIFMNATLRYDDI